MKRSLKLLAVMAVLGLLSPCYAVAQERSIIVASTTSTEQSGLFGFILPLFTARTGIRVNVVAVGTGQALDIGRRGDADVVFVHDRPAEEKFMAEGFGVKRFDVMYNDFVIIGPEGRSRAHRGRQGRRRGVPQDRGGPRAVRLARRPFRHPCGGAALLEGRRDRHRRGQGPLVSRHRPGHGTGAQHGVERERLCARRPRHLALVQEPRRARQSWSRATSGCSTSTA